MEIEGVEWQNYWKFNPSDEFDVVWIWRHPEVFDYDLTARLRILDLHDVMRQADFTPERVAKMDKIFVKTEYHRSLYPMVPNEKFVVIGNGIDLARFKGYRVKEPYRFIYSSTPNRGLDIVLKIWGRLKEHFKDAELHLYYGWESFEKIEKNNPERMAWMNKMKKEMMQPGIINHGRVGQKELANDELLTSFWLYPTYFPEIHCITACEMQAAGVIPLTSGYAALEETQKCGLKFPGDVHDPVWQDAYLKKIIDWVEDTHHTSHERARAKEEAEQFSWGKVAKQWSHELK